jgi:hypothetical protein
MQLELLPNSLKHMKKALQRKPNYEKVQLNKRLHHIVQHLNLEMSISKVHWTYYIQMSKHKSITPRHLQWFVASPKHQQPSTTLSYKFS